MSTISGLHRRDDSLEKDLDSIPEPGEKGLLLLPCKDGIDGVPCDTLQPAVETAYSRTIFYRPGASESEIARLIDG